MSGPQPWTRAQAAALLRVPGPSDHKYTRGVLGLRTGGDYPGAAVLGAEAAWRTGLGMLRYTPTLGGAAGALGLPSPAAAVLAARPETVISAAPDHARTDAWLIGSGTDPAQRSFAEREALLRLLAGEVPVVVDAGALGLVAEATVNAPVIVTPHLGEFQRLCETAAVEMPRELGHATTRARKTAAETHHAAEQFAETATSLATVAASLAAALGVTVLLKGSRTIAASPEGDSLIVGPATPWLATAGTGDVLAGILGALVASHAGAARSLGQDAALLKAGTLAELGATAALLHDTAARLAAGVPPNDSGADVVRSGTVGHAAYPETARPGGASAMAAAGGGHPITALDVAHAIPQAFTELRSSAATPAQLR